MGWSVVRAVRRLAIYIDYPGDMHLQTSFLAELHISGAKQQLRLIVREKVKVRYAVRKFMQLAAAASELRAYRPRIHDGGRDMKGART